MKKDHQILKSISEGNALAFRLMYDEYKGLVYNTAIGFCHDVNGAEEITQDVFTNVFRSSGSFNGKSSVKTWVYRITINTSLNFIKKKKKTSLDSIEDWDEAEINHPGILLENKENATILANVIDSLSENQRTAFTLSYIDGIPRQKVADVMGISLKAVESLLMRAKQNLRTKLEMIYPNRRKK